MNSRRLIDCYAAAERHLAHTKKKRPFNADVRSLLYMISWSDRGNKLLDQAWVKIKSRFNGDPIAYEKYRFRLESAMLNERWHMMGPQEIHMTGLGNRYTHHPIAAYEEIRSKPYFEHITDLQISDEISEHHYWAYGSGPWREPPRIDMDGVYKHLRRAHGLYCKWCNQPEFLGREPTVFDSSWFDEKEEPETRKTGTAYIHSDQWEEHAICDDCLIADKRRRFLADERRRIQDHKFKLAQAAKRKAAAAQREKANAEYRARREAAKAAREQEKIDREAAYQLVKELGLLEQVRSMKGTTNEAGRTQDTSPQYHAGQSEVIAEGDSRSLPTGLQRRQSLADRTL